MGLNVWKKIRQELEIKNPWWTYRKDKVLLPSGKQGEYHFVHVKGSSMILPVTGEGKIILVNQYRYLTDRESIEFPCGSVKENSTYEETARHELAEETGFDAGNIVAVAEFNPYNGVTDEICKVYIARKLYPVDVAHDETEEFEILFKTPAEVDSIVRDGKMWDGMSLSAWALTRHLFLRP
jgi:ADP-ribose pyrophosphatase